MDCFGGSKSGSKKGCFGGSESVNYIDKNGNSLSKDQLLARKNDEQKQVIKYFFGISSGCFSKGLSDDEYMAIFNRYKGSIDFRKRALAKIGLDEDQIKEIPPATFEGFAYSRAYAKQNAQGKWLSSKYEITWLFFSSEQVYLYSYTFNTDDGSIKEETNEYFYKDITSFSTSSDYVETITSKGKVSVGTNTFKMVVPGDTFTCSMEANANTESIIQAMKQKLREKKG